LQRLKQKTNRMKNIFLGLIATVMFSVSGFASDIKSVSEQNLKNPISKSLEKSAIAILKLESNNSTVNYQFSKIKDFSNYSDQLISSFISESTTDECSVTITMSVTVTVEASLGIAGGSVSTTVSGSITTSCANAVTAGKALKAQLLAMASA
jgi:hypothetical protein